MKTFLSLFIFLNIIIGFANAQPPQAIPYQGVARNASGNIIPSQLISLRISIHNTSANGSIVFKETQAITTSSLGLFNINIGNGTAIVGTLTGINWGDGNKFLQAELDVTGGSNYVDMGTTQLMSVPYALFAGTSSNNNHYIGESYGGGTVFYVYDNGQHGLIVSPSDQSAEVQWYDGTTNSVYSIYSFADGIGAGLKNTTLIVASDGAANNYPYIYNYDYPAAICYQYNVTANNIMYGDWYLPSKYELNLLYLQKNLVGGITNNGEYWSSTSNGESSLSGAAWAQNMSNGSQILAAWHGPTYRVRAIRSF